MTKISTLTAMALVMALAAPAAFAAGENSPVTGEHRSVNDPMSPRNPDNRGSIFKNWGNGEDRAKYERNDRSDRYDRADRNDRDGRYDNDGKDWDHKEYKKKKKHKRHHDKM